LCGAKTAIRFAAWGGATREGYATMKSINTKLILSALGIALLATPALAQTSQRHEPRNPQAQQYQDPGAFTDNSGAFTPHYVPGFGNDNVGGAGY
jgi:hypothetical protein